jgi:hypothetical protein
MHSRSSYRLRAPARRTSQLHSCLAAPRRSAKFGKFEVRRLPPHAAAASQPPLERTTAMQHCGPGEVLGYRHAGATCKG